MSAAYAFAACAVRAFADNNWPADVRGVEIDRVGGGLITDLAAEPFASGPPHAWPRTAVEYQFSNRQEHALVEVGLMPVGVLPFGPDMVFGASRSMQAPASYSGASGRRGRGECPAFRADQLDALRRPVRPSPQGDGPRHGGRLPHRRRDRAAAQSTGSRTTSTPTSTAPSESRARFPLVEGNVQVRERPGKPGVFGCTIHLRPHYQLDDVATAFHLVTELAAPGA